MFSHAAVEEPELSQCESDGGGAGGGSEGRRSTQVDRHVGDRIRERRTMLGLSQQQFAAMIGVTYQQAHKYERGLNRISAGRLFEAAEVLAVPIAWFFDGFAPQTDREISPRQHMSLELARNFAAIGDAGHRHAISQLARTLAAQSPAAEG